LQLSLYTNKMFCRDRHKTSLHWPSDDIAEVVTAELQCTQKIGILRDRRNSVVIGELSL